MPLSESNIIGNKARQPEERAAVSVQPLPGGAAVSRRQDKAAEEQLEAAGAELADCPPMFRNAPSSGEFNKLRKRLLRHMRQAIDDFAMLAAAQAPAAAGGADIDAANGRPAESAAEKAASAIHGQRPAAANSAASAAAGLKGAESAPAARQAAPAAGKKPKWLVALSGGKDSYGLLALLLDLQWRGLLPVELLACNLDQGQPGFPKNILPDYLKKNGLAYRIEYQDTYSIVTDKLTASQTYCSLCSRLRRGILYRIAREEGCSAVVLGHHRDDALETFFMNLFHGGRLAAMPAKLLNDEGNMLVLRPLIYAAEEDLARFAAAMRFPIIPCNLCGSQDGLQRNAMKAMLADIEKRMPGRKDTMMRALSNIRPSHLLDKNLFDFSALMA